MGAAPRAAAGLSARASSKVREGARRSRGESNAKEHEDDHSARKARTSPRIQRSCPQRGQAAGRGEPGGGRARGRARNGDDRRRRREPGRAREHRDAHAAAGARDSRRPTPCSTSRSRDCTIWRARLDGREVVPRRRDLPVGRIELTGSPYDWIGTGWLVHENILVTNRHVANEFAIAKATDSTSSVGDRRRRSTRPSTSCRRSAIRHARLQAGPAAVHPGSAGPDVSFFEIEVVRRQGEARQPIALAEKTRSTKNVAVIGYPAYDSRIPDADLMERIYGRTYNKKRLAPGGVTRVEQPRILHDCTTLGGNSGSAVSRPRQRQSARAALQRQVPDDQLRGARGLVSSSWLTCAPGASARGEGVRRDPAATMPHRRCRRLGASRRQRQHDHSADLDGLARRLSPGARRTDGGDGCRPVDDGAGMDRRRGGGGRGLQRPRRLPANFLGDADSWSAAVRRAPRGGHPRNTTTTASRIPCSATSTTRWS